MEHVTIIHLDGDLVKLIPDTGYRLKDRRSNILYSEVHSTKFEEYVKAKYKNAEIFRTNLENIDFAIDFALKHAELRSNRA